MLTGEIRGQIDAIWNAFWTGGISKSEGANLVLLRSFVVQVENKGVCRRRLSG